MPANGFQSMECILIFSCCRG